MSLHTIILFFSFIQLFDYRCLLHKVTHYKNHISFDVCVPMFLIAKCLIFQTTIMSPFFFPFTVNCDVYFPVCVCCHFKFHLSQSLKKVVIFQIWTLCLPLRNTLYTVGSSVQYCCCLCHTYIHTCTHARIHTHLLNYLLTYLLLT